MKINVKRPRDYFWISLSFIVGLILGSSVTFIIFKFNGTDLRKEVKSDTNQIEVKSNPLIDILNINDKCAIYVDIDGAVKKPGVYCVKDNAIWNDVLKEAGGYSKNYAVDFTRRNINLAKKIENNTKIYIPFEKEQKCSLLDFRYRVSDVSNVLGNSTNEEQCISINDGELEDITKINGVGESTAKKIIEGRPYKRIEDLMNVSGIGQATFDKLKAQICL